MNSQKKLIQTALFAFIVSIGMNSCQSSKNSGCNYWSHQESEITNEQDLTPKDIKYKVTSKSQSIID